MQLRPHQQRALDALASHTKGQVIIPTGGGKTLIAIKDAQRQFEEGNNTIVVVAPRILLAHQLCAEFLEHIDNAEVMHVHSGRTHHFSTTKATEISVWATKKCAFNQLIFTTYHSLHRLQAVSYTHLTLPTIYSV